MQIVDVPVQNAVEKGPGVYADILTHCRDYANFVAPGDRPTSAHECTHGINAWIRNQHAGYGIKRAKFGQITHMGTAVFLPTKKVRAGAARVNAFYVLGGRGLVVPEPPFRKSAVAAYIPAEYRKGRYGLYVAGQKEWDDSPLYLYDEWSAYINGAAAAIDLRVPAGSDWVLGPLEFVPYALAVCMAAQANGCLTDDLKEATRYQLVRAFNVFLAGRNSFPFTGQDALYESLKGAPYGDFMMAVLNCTVPTTVVPEYP